MAISSPRWASGPSEYPPGEELAQRRRVVIVLGNPIQVGQTIANHVQIVDLHIVRRCAKRNGSTPRTRPETLTCSGFKSPSLPPIPGEPWRDRRRRRNPSASRHAPGRRSTADRQTAPGFRRYSPGELAANDNKSLGTFRYSARAFAWRRRSRPMIGPAPTRPGRRDT